MDAIYCYIKLLLTELVGQYRKIPLLAIMALFTLQSVSNKMLWAIYSCSKLTFDHENII